jgi:parvulin-like peptidyl-prolyl isomerase
MRKTLLLCAAAAFFLGGCATVNNFVDRMTGKDTAQPVAPDEFMQRQSAADRSETLNGDTQMVVTPAAPRTAAKGDITHIDTGAASSETAISTTQPATQPVGVSSAVTTEPTLASGQYLAMGGVVADVNGTPIYINKVLQLVWPTLKNDAKTMNAEQFYQAAGDVIARQIRGLELDELLYASALRNLDTGDQKLAADLTTAYREELKTLAGGSVEEARRRAEANGDDFDQLIENQHRNFMIRLYQQRKFSPRVEPSAEDMRLYYRQNLETLFTERSEVVFDVLAIDPSLMGGDSAAANHDAAFEKAKQAHDRAAMGVSFATLFSEYNNDPGLRALTNGTGAMQAMPRGGFAKKDVEDAVWKLQPNQVTDVVESGGVEYVAKLESIKQGQVKPFEDEIVQEAIAKKIRDDRLAVLNEQEEQKLLDESIRNDYPDMFQEAVNIAMQNYHSWNGAK